MTRKKWWRYIKSVIRDYPERITAEEKSAVDTAINLTKELPDGEERLKVIDMVLWKRTHTVAGAAMKIPCSERTAAQWHMDFIYLVAENYVCLKGLN